MQSAKTQVDADTHAFVSGGANRADAPPELKMFRFLRRVCAHPGAAWMY